MIREKREKGDSMKNLVLIFFILSQPVLLNAKDGKPETEGLYIVPTPGDLVADSRFIVEIVTPFSGPETEKIAYIFPEALIGQTDRLIEFSRIKGTDNSWVSDELTAHCTTIDDFFSCNLYLNQTKQVVQMTWPWGWIVNKASAATQALCSGSFFSAVNEHFCSNEPAGILTYEFR